MLYIHWMAVLSKVFIILQNVQIVRFLCEVWIYRPLSHHAVVWWWMYTFIPHDIMRWALICNIRVLKVQLNQVNVYLINQSKGNTFYLYFSIHPPCIFSGKDKVLSSFTDTHTHTDPLYSAYLWQSIRSRGDWQCSVLFTGHLLHLTFIVAPGPWTSCKRHWSIQCQRPGPNSASTSSQGFSR